MCLATILVGKGHFVFVFGILVGKGSILVFECYFVKVSFLFGKGSSCGGLCAPDIVISW